MRPRPAFDLGTRMDGRTDSGFTDSTTFITSYFAPEMLIFDDFTNGFVTEARPYGRPYGRKEGHSVSVDASNNTCQCGVDRGLVGLIYWGFI